MFYPRSALKYVQILPLLESGCMEKYNFTLEEISVMCASHGNHLSLTYYYSNSLTHLDGEPRHLELVRSILAKVGLKETDLGYLYFTYRLTHLLTYSLTHVDAGVIFLVVSRQQLSTFVVERVISLKEFIIIVVGNTLVFLRLQNIWVLRPRLTYTKTTQFRNWYKRQHVMYSGLIRRNYI